MFVGCRIINVLSFLQDGNKGLTLEARKERDAEVMRLKQQKAADKKEVETKK